MAAKASRRHLMAVNKAVRAAGLDEQGLDAPMVELTRDLARQMDAASVDGPSARLFAAYLSATKDLSRAAERVAAEKRRGKPASEGGAPEVGADGRAKLQAVEKDPLAAFNEKHNVGARRTA